MCLIERMRERVEISGVGAVFSPKDFIDLGNRGAIYRALSHLVRGKFLRRISRGLYDFPRVSNILKGVAPPDIDAAVMTIARRDNIRVMLDGVIEAHRLGLTNGVPARTIYLTDGPTRIIRIGGRTIYFRHVGQEIMTWYGSNAQSYVLALYWLGEGHEIRLPDPIKQELIDGIDRLPAWMASIVKDKV